MEEGAVEDLGPERAARGHHRPAAWRTIPHRRAHAASRFSDAAAIYLAKIERKREDSTHALYAFHLKATILPALGALRLRECTVARLDAFLEALEPRYAANTRRKLRSIVSGVLQVAVLQEAIVSNPVRELDRIEQPKGQRKARSRGLTLEERRRLLDWLDGSSGDPATLRKQKIARSADLPDLVRFFLGTGLRIGEALATRCPSTGSRVVVGTT